MYQSASGGYYQPPGKKPGSGAPISPYGAGSRFAPISGGPGGGHPAHLSYPGGHPAHLSQPPQRRKVVVVQNQKSARNNKALGPIIAGAAVLALGGTLGLWYSTANTSGGQVIAGNLDLQAPDRLTWYDVSPDRADGAANATAQAALNNLLPNTGAEVFAEATCLPVPANTNPDYPANPGKPGDWLDPDHTIRSNCDGDYNPTYPFTAAHVIEDTQTWRAVPGDTIVGVIRAELTLEGDNLVAGLAFECDEPQDSEFYTGALTTGNIVDLVTVDTELFVTPQAAAHTTLVRAAPPFPSGPMPYIGYFEAPMEGQGFGAPDQDWVGSPNPFVHQLGSIAPGSSVGQGYATVLIKIHFSEAATDRQLAELPLAEIFSGRMVLDQVRGVGTPGQFIQAD